MWDFQLSSNYVVLKSTGGHNSTFRSVCSDRRTLLTTNITQDILTIIQFKYSSYKGFTLWYNITEPTAPLNVRIKSVDEDSITIEWTEPNPPHGVITNYDVAYGRTGDEQSATVQEDIGVTPLIYQIMNLEINITYNIQVWFLTLRSISVSFAWTAPDNIGFYHLPFNRILCNPIIIKMSFYY